jgi:hypothetical protein
MCAPYDKVVRAPAHREHILGRRRAQQQVLDDRTALLAAVPCAADTLRDADVARQPRPSCMRSSMAMRQSSEVRHVAVHEVHDPRKASVGVSCHAARWWEQARAARTHEAVEEGREVQQRAPAGARVADEQRVHLPQAPPGDLLPRDRDPQRQNCLQELHSRTRTAPRYFYLGWGGIPIGWSPRSAYCCSQRKGTEDGHARYATPGLVMQPRSTRQPRTSAVERAVRPKWARSMLTGRSQSRHT